MKPTRQAAAAAVAAVLSFLLAGCSRRSDAAPSARSASPPEVRVSPVVKKDVPVYGDWVATLDGYVNANIQPQVTGYLVTQAYREGSFVHKDEVLFEIDPRPFQAALDRAQGQLAEAKAQLTQAQGQLAQARAQLKLAQINVTRDTPLAAAHAIPQSQLDTDTQAQAQAEALVTTDQAAIESSRAAIQAADAAVEQAQLNLGFTHVRSLIDGIAGIATVQMGNLVSPTAVLTTVSSLDPIKTYFSISEQEYLAMAGAIHSDGADMLRQGSSIPLQLTLSNNQVYPHQGHIVFADRQVDPQTGTIRIVGAFPNPGNVLRPGQFGRIRALTSFHKDALLVPERAVNQMQGRSMVAVVAPGDTVSLRTVQTGDRVDGMWIVQGGLQAGERVVTEGTLKIGEGAHVTPKPDSGGGQ
ncbi:MAG TPA: efflux RND transporter periplasmic adaptor subunit [Bryobacteraceae bacterium]|nr:efflux RND transporter periplasmic adaptor subunit [Bryobacteraceae bacterium]